MAKTDANTLTALMHDTIPMLAFAQWRLTAIHTTEANAFAPLTPNRNIHGTGFAGAQYVVAVATGWAFVQYLITLADMKGEVVLRNADIRYRRPVRGDMTIVAQMDASAPRRAHQYPVNATITVEEKVCANFSGVYVFLPA